tara:strand:- start:751 stop:2046 length:1296 start_codon:yes stop_codon:yes gene_type:complete
MKKLLISFIFLFINFFYNPVFAESKNKETYELLDLFGQIFDRVRDSYVEEVTDEELIEKAIDGMLTGLDPHSGYMDEDVWDEMQMDTQGKFGGLGIEITMEEGFVKVISPIEDTPAYRAGVKAGDYIIQIEETPVYGLTLTEAVELLRGERGTPIKITISREGLEPFEIEIVRDFIKLQSVKEDIFNQVGYLRITSFTEQTEKGLKESIKSINQKLKDNELGYILDLRSNPGGLLTQAVKVTDIFLNQGEIVSTRGRNKNDMKRYRAKFGDLIKNKPLVVIINGGSASASEIVAGALQDHKRAIVIGTKSFGKGSVQTIIPFKKSNDKMAGIRLTTARYYTPSGESIQGKGIEPDIIVEQGSFEASDFKRISESDLKGSLDKDEDDDTNVKDEENENVLTPQEERLAIDFQLARAVDLIVGLSIYQESNLN